MNENKAIVPFGNMFDNVRVRVTPETEAVGLAGCTGQVYGESVPTSSGIALDEIVGELKEDYAVNVHFDEPSREIWFTQDLLEFVDHAPGSQIEIGGVTRTRTEAGEWVETSRDRAKRIAVWVVIAVGVIAIVAIMVK